MHNTLPQFFMKAFFYAIRFFFIQKLFYLVFLQFWHLSWDSNRCLSREVVLLEYAHVHTAYVLMHTGSTRKVLVQLVILVCMLFVDN